MLIHCTEGAHRGPFASAVWLMAKTGRTMHDVVKYLEQLRCLVHLRTRTQRSQKTATHRLGDKRIGAMLSHAVAILAQAILAHSRLRGPRSRASHVRSQ